MQVNEIKKDKFYREYEVVIPAAAVEQNVNERLQSIGQKVKIPGFRPGRVPIKILKQRYGKSIMGEVLENTVTRASHEVLQQKSDKPVLQPKLEITKYDDGQDLHFKMSYEIMPKLPDIDLTNIKLEKLVYDIPESDIEKGVKEIAQANKSYKSKAKTAKAQEGDVVKIDFEGFIDGKAFDGGAAKEHNLELGSGQFIPGFEEQLIGCKAGDNKTIKVTFPKDYHSESLAGKEAEFKVFVHEVLQPVQAKADDELAKKLGLENLEQLKEALAKRLREDYDKVARTKLKKQLFDILEEKYDFEVPEGMVSMEFDSIWKALQEAKKQGDDSIADKSEDELRKEYRAIAERRVRLGLILAEIGNKNNFQVNQDELSKAVMDRARMFPGQEAKIFEYYQKNPQQLDELRGPILEEKAVDYIISQAKLSEKKVTIEQLLADEEDEPVTGKKPGKKKAAAKKTTTSKKVTAKASSAKKTADKSAKRSTKRASKKTA